MKIVSWNQNGVVPTLNNGYFRYFNENKPDILCLQEIRTNSQPTVLDGYKHFWNPAEREGYAGTAMILRSKPIAVNFGMGEFYNDRDGRVITAELPDFFLVTAYVPNSQKNLERKAFRREWDDAFREYICDLRDTKPVIICGDFNVTRSEMDVFAENMRQYWATQNISTTRLLFFAITRLFKKILPYVWYGRNFFTFCRFY